MPKTRKATRRMKKRKLTRRQPRKMRGGVLTDVQQKAIFICDVFINRLNKQIAWLEHQEWTNRGRFSMSFNTIDNRFQMRDKLEPYKPGIEYLIEHMEQKQNDKTFKKSLQEKFTKEELAPYAETISTLEDFKEHIFNFKGMHGNFDIYDTTRLKKRFEKIKEEIQNISTKN